jgi:hypothetical protein
MISDVEMNSGGALCPSILYGSRKMHPTYAGIRLG